MQNGGWYTTSPSKLKSCRRCHAPMLAWVESKRTGRFYLAETRPYIPKEGQDRDVRWVMPNVPHSCERFQKEQEQRERQRDLDRQREEYGERLVSIVNDTSIDVHERISQMDALAREYPDVSHRHPAS